MVFQGICVENEGPKVMYILVSFVAKLVLDIQNGIHIAKTIHVRNKIANELWEKESSNLVLRQCSQMKYLGV